MANGKIFEMTFPQDGMTRKVMEMDFTSDREEWNVYRLSDGSTVRLKSIVVKILRVMDQGDRPAYTADGEPWFIVRSTNTVSASE